MEVYFFSSVFALDKIHKIPFEPYTFMYGSNNNYPFNLLFALVKRNDTPRQT